MVLFLQGAYSIIRLGNQPLLRLIAGSFVVLPRDVAGRFAFAARPPRGAALAIRRSPMVAFAGHLLSRDRSAMLPSVGHGCSFRGLGRNEEYFLHKETFR